MICALAVTYPWANPIPDWASRKQASVVEKQRKTVCLPPPAAMQILPATLLIDGEGCVLGTLNGPAEWASDDAKKLVQTAF